VSGLFQHSLDSSNNLLAQHLNIAIRPATPDDWPAIVEINDSAFEGASESALIAALERSGRPVISLLALADDVRVGHIFFSPIRIESPGPPIPAAALAPMAVTPRFQGKGIGTQLVEAGLRECIEQGYQVVVVVGHPRFYQRFGFRRAAGAGLESVYSEAGDAFMVIELASGVLRGRTGVVQYPDEFAGV
jgi:putative acetyltransferase